MNVAEILGTIMLGVLIIVGYAFLTTIPFWWLWNWLMPTLFGLARITILQALGLLLLSGFLLRRGGKCSSK